MSILRPNWPCAVLRIDWDCAFAFTEKIFQAVLTLYFRSTSLPCLCTDVFGITTRNAKSLTYQNLGFSIGEEKFRKNIQRDERNRQELSSLGWRVLVIWECDTKDPGKVQELLVNATNGLLPTIAAKNRKAPELSHDEKSTGDVLKPCFIDVFAGCGALSLGLERAGWKGLLAIEKDACAYATLSHNFLRDDSPLSYDWPKGIEKKAWDIHHLLLEHENELRQMSGKIDLLAGGPPCQGFSHAGRRRHDDPRNDLFLAYLKLVNLLRPRLVLIENVRGFNSDFKIAHGTATKNFADALKNGLCCDYDLASSIIQARDFGLPQVRPRFFLVGALKSAGVRQQVASFFENMQRQSPAFLAERDLPRRPSARDAIGDLEVTRNGTVPCEDSYGFDAIGYAGPFTSYQIAMREGYEEAPPDMRLARHRPNIRRRFEEIISACREEGRLNVTISKQTREAHGLKKMAIRVLDPLGAAPTITSLPDDLLHYSEPRILTVRENARLQSFPDWFAFKGKYTTGGHRRRREVPRFTQVANAVPPILAEQLGIVLGRIVNVAKLTNN